MSQGHTDVPVQVARATVTKNADVCGDLPGANPCDAGLSDKAKACTVRQVLDRVGGKWSIGILVEAAQRPVRFTELERTVEGISRRMLTLTLRNLERDGLLTRTVYPTVPPKVEYVATDMARELYDTLLALTNWAERHREAIAAAREAYDREHGTTAN